MTGGDGFGFGESEDAIDVDFDDTGLIGSAGVVEPDDVGGDASVEFEIDFALGASIGSGAPSCIGGCAGSCGGGNIFAGSGEGHDEGVRGWDFENDDGVRIANGSLSGNASAGSEGETGECGEGEGKLHSDSS